MNCEDFLLMLDDYVEDELDRKSSAQVSAHLAACQSCADYYQELKREQELYSQYLPGVEATPALRAKVLAGVEEIQRERSSSGSLRKRLIKFFPIPSFNPTFAAASIALFFVFAATVGLIKYKSPENEFNQEIISQNNSYQIQSLPEESAIYPKAEGLKPNEKEHASAREAKIFIVKAENRAKKNTSGLKLSTPLKQTSGFRSTNSSRNLTIEDVVGKAERQYKGAIALLSDDIKRRRAQLSQNLTPQIEQALTDIDKTINETRQAVQAKPNDPVAIQYMTTAYGKKIELLRTIAGN